MTRLPLSTEITGRWPDGPRQVSKNAWAPPARLTEGGGEVRTESLSAARPSAEPPGN